MGSICSERQRGTVREDYSSNGNTWNYINHALARSYAYRWGEEAIGGFCDSDQVLCLAPAFWNGEDAILKERLFGLTNGEGNHGEDVKELYFHLDSSPTHSYCKFLYKYPQQAFPYTELLEQNKKDRLSPKYEILDTDIFKGNRYFDCYIEYAKAGINDVLMKITVYNRGLKPLLFMLFLIFGFVIFGNIIHVSVNPALYQLPPIASNYLKLQWQFLFLSPGGRAIFL